MLSVVLETFHHTWLLSLIPIVNLFLSPFLSSCAQDLIARVIDLQPSTAISLLCLSSRFFSSACKAIYEETAFQDDHRSLTRPASRSRIEALIRYPAK